MNWRREVLRRKEEAFDAATGMLVSVVIVAFFALIVAGCVGLICGMIG